MTESWKTRLFRWWINRFPCYWGTGARIAFIASNWKEVRLKIPLNWRTRNYVGTIFGGSMYGAVDPIYMLMLLKTLGPEYIVWDKGATIHFKKPGRTTLFGHFYVTDHELSEIQELLRHHKSIDRHYVVELRDKDGTLHASIEKTVYIRKKLPS